MPSPLTDAEVASGLKMMHPEWGYRYMLDEGGLIQPFDFHLPALQQLRTTFELQPTDVCICTYPKCGECHTVR